MVPHPFNLMSVCNIPSALFSEAVWLDNYDFVITNKEK